MKIVVTLIRKGWVVVSQGDVTVYVRGQAHLGDEYLNTEALAERILAVALQVSNLPPLVSALNGNWATVVNTSSSAFLAVDHVRSIQLLYSQEGEDFYVFDDVNDFRKEHKLEIDEDCAHEYLSSGYVYRNRTLFKDVHSLQAAEYVIASPIKASKPLTLQTTSTRYWRYVPNICKPVKTRPELVKKIDEAFLSVMRRLVESVGDKRIVVPLSGGCDSRLIVNYLYKLGVENVLCYSYGVKDNGESLRSRQVAERLGFDWHFVEYTSQMRTEYVNGLDVDSAILHMVNGVNRYCNQEFFAVRELKQKGVIHQDHDVIVPGYYFDVLAGSKIRLSTNDWTAISNTLEDENNFFLAHCLLRTLHNIKKVFEEHRDICPKAFFETFLWQERLSKFIVNNVRSFESLGFDWRLPLCDFALFGLWLSLPYALRYRRDFFYSIFDTLMDGRVRDVPIHGKGVGTFFVKIKDRVPYLMKVALHSVLHQKSIYGNGCLSNAKVDISQSVSSVVKHLPSTEKRLEGASLISSNAAVTVKALALEIDKAI